MANVTSSCRTYMLTFQADDMTQINIVRGWLRDSLLIESAMSPIGTIYVFKSYKSATELMVEMNFLFPNGRYLISQALIHTMDGVMPDSVWKWFDDNNDGNENEIKLPRTIKLLFPAQSG